MGVECNRVDFLVGESDGEDGCDSIVQGICFNCELHVWNPVSDYQSASKCLLDSAEGILAVIEEVPQSSFLGKTGQRNDNVGVIVDESLVEIGETQGRLDVLDFVGFGPILDNLDFCGIHIRPSGDKMNPRYSTEVVWN